MSNDLKLTFVDDDGFKYEYQFGTVYIRRLKNRKEYKHIGIKNNNLLELKEELQKVVNKIFKKEVTSE